LTLSLLLIGIVTASAQISNSKMSAKDSAYFSQPYPYILPILGDKAHNANARLPLHLGIMFNALAGVQHLTLSDMALGFGNINNAAPPNMIDMSDFIVYDDIKAQTSTYNMRFDAWILPFLNVYGIVGQTKKADINVNLIKPFPLSVTTETTGTYVGYGMMVAGAVGPLFVSLDGNQTYSYNPRLDNPAKISIGGLRTGPIFRFKNKPEIIIYYENIHYYPMHFLISSFC